MIAQIIPFPKPRQRWADGDADLISFGRALARKGMVITDDEARASALKFRDAVEVERIATAGMSSEERLQRLARMIATTLANSPLKAK